MCKWRVCCQRDERDERERAAASKGENSALGDLSNPSAKYYHYIHILGLPRRDHYVGQSTTLGSPYNECT